MAIFNIRAERHDRDGRVVAAPEVLMQGGPVLPAILTLPRDLEKALPGPRSLQGVALIDTGASRSCFDIEAAEEIGLPVRNTEDIASVSDVVKDVPIFAGELTILGLTKFDLLAAGLPLKRTWLKGKDTPPLIALVGRDILSRGMFVYNGPDGFASLAI